MSDTEEKILATINTLLTTEIESKELDLKLLDLNLLLDSYQSKNPIIRSEKLVHFLNLGLDSDNFTFRKICYSQLIIQLAVEGSEQFLVSFSFHFFAQQK